MDRHTFRAGAAQVDITPPLGTVINGEFTSRYANRIADPLFAKALVLDDNGQFMLILLVDTCAMQRDFLDEVRAAIEKEAGIPFHNQLIASTHTHSAGSVADLLMGHVDWAYRKRLSGLIVQAAQAACRRLTPAKIGWGSVDQPRHLLCRRYRMASGYRPINPVTGELDTVKTNPFGDEEHIIEPTSVPDPGLRYLAVQGLDGQWISLLANYSLHYVGDCPRGTISADYFGHFASAVASGVGANADFVGMMSNGTSGEINIWDFQQPSRYPKDDHKKSAFIGCDLAASVVYTLRNIEWELNPELDILHAYVSVGVRKPTPSELAHARQIVSDTDYEHVEFGQPRCFEQVYAREQVLLAEFPDYRDLSVQSFRIGDGAIGALGGEFFSETGLKIKDNWPNEKYFTICFANDYVGYVPPAHELEKGGYETWRCRTSFLATDAEDTIREKLVKQLKGLQKKV